MKLKHLPPANLNAAVALLQPACNDELTPSLLVAMIEAYNGSEPTEPKETLIDRAAACHRLGGISSTSLWRLVKNKQLHVRKVGRRAMFRTAEIDAFIRGDAA